MFLICGNLRNLRTFFSFLVLICANSRNLRIEICGLFFGFNLRESALRAVGFYPPACKPYGLEAEPEA
jgi:hypothetical protein